MTGKRICWHPEVVRATIDASQGLECTGYFTLNLRTAHLRRSLFVVLREEGAEEEIRPELAWEHFPVVELVQEGWRRRARRLEPHLGAGGKEIIFECYGPDAAEGARIISETMDELGPLLRSRRFKRLRSIALAEYEFKRKYVPLVGALHVDRKGRRLPEPPEGSRVPPAYRPRGREAAA